MNKNYRLFSFVLVLGLVLGACAPAVNNNAEMMKDDMQPTTEMMEETESDMATEEAPMDEMSSEEMMWPEWTTIDTLNVNTGETFQIADYKGKVVLVETLAMWCSNCKQQQQQVKALHEKLGDQPDFVSIGLDVDINETLDDLSNYTSANGFDWVYTVASKDLARGIANEFGAQFLNPPLTPIFLIDRHGEFHVLDFGIKTAADLEAAIVPLLEQMN